EARATPVGALAGRSGDEARDAMIRAGQAALRGGVTTVRDLGDRDYLSLGLRGRPGLPTILAAGPPVTTPAGHCHYLGGGAEPTEAGVRPAGREHAPFWTNDSVHAPAALSQPIACRRTTAGPTA